MPSRSRRPRGWLALWEAHRELTAVEWIEFRQALAAAVGWVVAAVIGVVTGWLAVNAAIVIALRDQPVRAAFVVAGANLVLAAFGAWRLRRIIRRSYFESTRREAARDLGSVLRGMP